MSIIGLKVKLDRSMDRERPCCRNLCIIGPGKGPHAGSFHCIDCGSHRGWLSQSTARWIQHVASRFGAPTTPIVVAIVTRRSGGAEHEHELNSN